MDRGWELKELRPWGKQPCSVSPTIANAVKNVVSVWIHDLPITPEKLFRGLATGR